MNGFIIIRRIGHTTWVDKHGRLIADWNYKPGEQVTADIVKPHEHGFLNQMTQVIIHEPYRACIIDTKDISIVHTVSSGNIKQ